MAKEITHGCGPEFMDLARRIAEAEVDVSYDGSGIGRCGERGSRTSSMQRAPRTGIVGSLRTLGAVEAQAYNSRPVEACAAARLLSNEFGP
jgi:hypothetical protein